MSAIEGERCSSSSAWSLPCHFHQLSLMNCKSKAEAFARSLHNKLKSLGRLSGEGQYFDQDDDYLASATTDATDSTATNTGDICLSASSMTASAPLTQPSSSSTSANGLKLKHRKPHDERTYLMSYVPQRWHHGSPDHTSTPTYLSPQHGEDELHFDFDISSPESPAEDDVIPGLLQHPPKSAQATGGPFPERHECYQPTAEEESGCISSVSSVITEQDNDDEDGLDEFCGLDPDYFQDAEISCPWSPLPPLLPVVTAQPMPTTLALQTCAEGSAGALSPVGKLGTILEQITLEESENVPAEATDFDHDLERGRDESAKGSDTKSEGGCCQTSSAGNELVRHEPESVLGTDDDERPMNRDDVAESEAGPPDRCGIGEETDESGQFDLPVGSDSVSDGLDDPSDQNGQCVEDGWLDEEEEAKEVSEKCTDFCRVCVSPPPAFLNLRVDCTGSDAADGNCGDKTCRLTVDLSLSPSSLSEEGCETPNDDDFPRRVRRSSSLKTGKTPPGTPNRKKIVRFADAMGLDLEAVKTVFLDDLPVVPSSAFVDLQDGAYLNEDTADDALSIRSLTIYNSNAARLHFPPFGLAKPRCSLIPVFPQPGSLPDFIDRVRKQNVCLESAVVTADFNICLVVRVLNLHFNKYVAIRYTFDNWANIQNQVAEYVADSTDAFSDKFGTVISAGQLQIGDRLLFAVQYVANGTEFWDNNNGQNYCFQCFVEQQYHLSPPDDSWIHFL